MHLTKTTLAQREFTWRYWSNSLDANRSWTKQIEWNKLWEGQNHQPCLSGPGIKEMPVYHYHSKACLSCTQERGSGGSISRPASIVRPQQGQGHRMGMWAGHQLLCFRSSAREGGYPCEYPQRSPLFSQMSSLLQQHMVRSCFQTPQVGGAGSAERERERD